MTFDELYQMVQDLKNQKIPGDTEVLLANYDGEMALVQCDYVTYWVDKRPDKYGPEEGHVEIG